MVSQILTIYIRNRIVGGRRPRRADREAAVRYIFRKMLRIFRRDVVGAVPYNRCSDSSYHIPKSKSVTPQTVWNEKGLLQILQQPFASDNYYCAA